MSRAVPGASSTGRAGATIWLTGLSGAGKTTIAAEVRRLLEAGPGPQAGGPVAMTLDGDDLREGLNSDLSFSAADRAENVRRVGEVALLFARHRHLVLVTVISPYAAGRDEVRRRHQDRGIRFVEVHVATPLEVCEERDPKGLYLRARAGEIPRFTGISDPYEPPAAPEIRLLTEGRSPGESAGELLGLLRGLGVVQVGSPGRGTSGTGAG